MDSLKKLEERIGISFKNKSLLKESVTHRSYINEDPKWSAKHNERLEFLGDAVLELIVTENLFVSFPEKDEGELTLYRSALVNYKILGAIASDLGLDEAIKMSKGEAKESLKSRGRETILANAIEAILGAIYLDKGYENSKKFVERFVMPHLKNIQIAGGKDPKSLVQEIAQSEHKITPTYRVLEESGPAHERIFTVGLYFGEDLKTEGKGASKQEAEAEAAGKWLAARS